MALQRVTDDELIALWKAHGSASIISSVTGIATRAIQSRRRRIEARYGIELKPAYGPGGVLLTHRPHEGRADLEIANGSVIVFSDGHFWPGIRTTAFRAMLAMILQIRPVAVVCNGDAFDGGAISRFPRASWSEKKPTVTDELDAVSKALGEIEAACAKAACVHRFWTLGNHDGRYEAFLAAHAPQYEGVHGFSLKDHFLAWSPAWSVWVNGDTEIRHRYRHGIHAVHNNIMANHHSTVTGHLHSAKVVPYTDGRGVTKYGVDTGTLADPTGPQFVDYLEGRHANWRQGFAVLTWRDGRLLMPELALKWDEDHVEFRGHVLNADNLEIA